MKKLLKEMPKGKRTSGYFSVLHVFATDKPQKPGEAPAEAAKKSSATANKCDHGFNKTILGTKYLVSGINKDHHGENALHPAAQSAATTATKEYLELVIAEIRKAFPDVEEQDQKLMDFFDVNLQPIGFVVDTTGSMGSIKQGVVNNITRIIDEYKTKNKENYKAARFLLTQFNDPGFGPTVVGNPDQIRAAAASIPIYGGGDCPELAFSGLVDALKKARRKSTLYVFTDASSSDSSASSVAQSMANAKEIKIHFITSGSCSPIDPAYYATAAVTGGSVILTSHNQRETEAIYPLLQAGLGDGVSIINATVTPTSTLERVPVQIDESISRMTTTISSMSYKTLRLIAPDGREATESLGAVGRVASANIYAIDNPQPGTWYAEVDLTERTPMPIIVDVTTNTPQRVITGNFVEWSGRPDHEGWFNLAGDPLGGEQTVRVEMSKPLLNPRIALMDASGRELISAALTLQDGTTALYMGKITVPQTAFKLVVIGSDSKGNKVQRMLPKLYGGKNLKLDTVWANNPFAEGQHAVIRYLVSSLVDGDVALNVQPSAGTVSYPSGNTVKLSKNGTAYIDADILLPLGMTDDLQVTATITTGSGLNENRTSISSEEPVHKDTDRDGVADISEQGLSGGDPLLDNDGDGVPDFQQARVVSTWSADHTFYLSFVGNNGSVFSNFNNKPIPANANIASPLLGASTFTLSEGTGKSLTILLPSRLVAGSLWSPVKGKLNEPWQQIPASGLNNAAFGKGEIAITLEDGGLFDMDQVVNGQVTATLAIGDFSLGGQCKAWQEGATYKIGDVTSFSGKIYTTLQSHTALSTASWSPANAPSLWQVGGVCGAPVVPSCKAWTEGTAFVAGDAVKYNSAVYTAIITHTPPVGANWNPSVAQSLWVKDGVCQ
ncbi:hypothetical protein GM173_05860 [Deefgea chitinilytica]|uniref:Chitin-binding type-3 domain-containing protein n=1 Tax=Deefgea chitinilytica TaxID=570276 RepID=A0ABS2CBT2_9NEIS|nr:hypothetical protein [Deefgea chitinilytica]